MDTGSNAGTVQIAWVVVTERNGTIWSVTDRQRRIAAYEEPVGVPLFRTVS